MSRTLRRASRLAGAVLPAAAVAAGALRHVPYVGLRVSDELVAANGELISVRGAARHRPRPSIHIVAVWGERDLTCWEYVWYRLAPNHDVVHADVAYGGVPRAVFEQRGRDEMARAKQTATFVALRALGLRAEATGTGAEVTAVLAGPAAGRLHAGDVIVAVDGRAVTLKEDVVAAVLAARVGATLHFDVLRTDPAPGEPTVAGVDVTLGAHTSGLALLGATLVTRDLRFDFDLDVRYDVDPDTAGPSAGLAFTLGLLDVLTPGELTGGRQIAATGAISSDGRVGPVGGVTKKAVAASRAGLELFVVPAGQGDEARAGASGRLEIVEAGHVADAVEALVARGGDRPQLPTR